MKRFVLSAIAAVIAFVAVRWIVHALASDETRIRWTLESMADGFNDTRTNKCLAGLAPDFRDETYGADRQDVQRGLARLFFEKKDPKTRGFLYRVELPRDAMEIEVDANEARTARATVLARFLEKQGDAESVAWETRIAAELVKRDGDWLVHGSEHTILVGRMPR